MKLLIAGYLLVVAVPSVLSETIHGLVVFTRHGDSKFLWGSFRKSETNREIQERRSFTKGIR